MKADFVVIHQAVDSAFGLYKMYWDISSIINLLIFPSFVRNDFLQ
jgi:hypothetical protein